MPIFTIRVFRFMTTILDFPTTIYRSHYARIRTKEFHIYCFGPSLRNYLPDEFKTLPSINSFKYQLKQLLINN